MDNWSFKYIRTDASVISVNNIIYLAGGSFNNYTNYSDTVYKLEL